MNGLFFSIDYHLKQEQLRQMALNVQLIFGLYQK